ncbi:bromodomain testis-specific protein-like isoform X1 [Sceloporus undulatus]|uniref:bromodomain testis-specific protein-like isoform X1 n=1 Tax=Sceloporus undulatus TaxID=8520 RepID=UPI001C4BF80A|nr:bromodomain testis-specific protein-like isoform X1 [Sceloporus undulatus]
MRETQERKWGTKRRLVRRRRRRRRREGRKGRARDEGQPPPPLRIPPPPAAAAAVRGRRTVLTLVGGLGGGIRRSVKGKSARGGREGEEGCSEGTSSGHQLAPPSLPPSFLRVKLRGSCCRQSKGFLLSLKTEQRKKRSYNFKTELAMEVIMDLHIHFRFTVVCADIFV